MSGNGGCVSVLRCGGYERELVREVLIRHFDNLGGLERFVSRGDRVLIKPNLILPRSVDVPAQTHPSLIVETARLLLDAGARPLVGDSPAWSVTRECIKVLGVLDELERMGVKVVNLGRPKKIRLEGNDARPFVSRYALEAERIFNIPKLKAHQQMVFSAAVKNMYGVLSGKRKALWHYRKGHSHSEFAEFVIALHRTVRPTVNIVDAVTSMQGQGPIRGDRADTGFIAMGEDAFSCDLVCSGLVGYSFDEIPILAEAKKMGLLGDIEDVDIVGDTGMECVCPEFVKAEPSPLRFTLGRILKSAARQAMILLHLKGKG